MSYIRSDFSDDLKQAINVLRDGGLVLVPSDIGWGICCDATNGDSVVPLRKLIDCPENKRLGIITDNIAKTGNYLDVVPDIAWDLFELSTKPLTIVFENARNLPDDLTGSGNTIGIRITQDIFLKKLCERFRKPLVFTKARKYNSAAKEKLTDIHEDIKNQCDYIVVYRSTEIIKTQQASVIKLGIGNLVKIIRE